VSALAELVRSRRGDPLPADIAPVLLVPVGGPPIRSTVERAVAEAAGGTVAVVTMLRIHGSAWGFPNPGLLPNAREKAEARRIVELTIAAVERAGGHADGQITATRHPGRVVAAAARRRGARLVIVERPPVGRVRAAVEGDLGASVRRRLRSRSAAEVAVEVVDHPGRPMSGQDGMR
jgi:hypothetical protein